MVSDLNIFVWNWSIIASKKKDFFGGFCLTKHGGNQTSRWIRDLWSKAISQILAHFQTFLSVCVLDVFFRFPKNSDFGVFLVHLETTLPDGLEISGQRVYRYFWHISRHVRVFALWMIFYCFSKKIMFWGILGPPYCAQDCEAPASV